MGYQEKSRRIMLSVAECRQARISRDPRFDGVFFVLVKTTGIFCRNTCRVRMPLEKNVEYSFDARQAMSKGYRPCLKCRPDSAPNSPAWRGANTTVVRAIELLSKEFHLSMSEIASKLGITNRYLNKLFQQHMQVTPKAFRIYQQMLEAKKLLQQTTLSVEHVAEAVGLPSARQLQLHAKKHLRLSPTEIRKSFVWINPKNNTSKTSEQSDMKEPLVNTVQMLLEYRPPYEWDSMQAFFEKRCIVGNEKIQQNGLSKILVIDDHAVPINLVHIPKKNGFLLEFNSAFSKHTLAIVKTAKQLLDLDADPITIENKLIKSGLLPKEVIKGLRIPGVANEFEAACRAILGQQVSVAAAVNKLNSFFEYFALKRDGKLQTRFPLPLEVANDDLSFLRIPNARRQTLIDVAKFFATEYIGETEKNLIESNQRLNKMLNIKGVGPWTLNYVNMRSSGNTDVWLDTDLVIKKQIQKLKQEGRDLDYASAAPWRSYLTINLWRNSE